MHATPPYFQMPDQALLYLHTFFLQTLLLPSLPGNLLFLLNTQVAQDLLGAPFPVCCSALSSSRAQGVSLYDNVEIAMARKHLSGHQARPQAPGSPGIGSYSPWQCQCLGPGTGKPPYGCWATTSFFPCLELIFTLPPTIKQDGANSTLPRSKITLLAAAPKFYWA